MIGTFLLHNACRERSKGSGVWDVLKLSPVANSPHVMVSVAVNGGFALLHCSVCIPGGWEGGGLSPDELNTPLHLSRETSHHGAILTGTRGVSPSIRPRGEGRVTAGPKGSIEPEGVEEVLGWQGQVWGVVLMPCSIRDWRLSWLTSRQPDKQPGLW